MLAARRFGVLHPVHTTNFIPRVDPQACTGCGKCVDGVPRRRDVAGLGARPETAEEEDGAGWTRTSASAAASAWRPAREGHLRLASRPARVITPLNSAHRIVVMAIERGKLQNLIFDNQALG